MGRPRKYAIGTTASRRVKISTDALVAAGGARKTFRLSPRANQALQFLKSEKSAKTETAVVESLLLSEEAKIKQTKKRQVSDMEQKKKAFIVDSEDSAINSGSASALIGLIASGEMPVQYKSTDFAECGDVIVDAATLIISTPSKRTVITSTLRLSEQCKNQEISVRIDGKCLTGSVDSELVKTLCRVFWVKGLMLSHTDQSLEMSKVINVC